MSDVEPYWFNLMSVTHKKNPDKNVSLQNVGIVPLVNQMQWFAGCLLALFYTGFSIIGVNVKKQNWNLL